MKLGFAKVVTAVCLCVCLCLWPLSSCGPKTAGGSRMTPSAVGTTISHRSADPFDDADTASPASTRAVSAAPKPPVSQTPAAEEIDYTAPPLSLAGPHWPKVDALYIVHTQSPPFKAATLRRGTAEFDQLTGLLKQVQGRYAGSSEGLSGGFMPIYLISEGVRLDRVQISVTGSPRFSSDSRQNASANIPGSAYPALYAMDPSLSEELNRFLESLPYTEEIHFP